ncbi:hypothetical protein AMET1_1062 [Methanonatronarchaeum thermophilum]|uniref:Uncharacterized protein n=1 Tax=Methanonatronarchaeum thermophilum TaxID=1927129 RepID=A0A1Y3G9S5_9EURY|nr:hypothetical protein [Methanonatronarchaeum thermophilum]OUJ18159.1 hypothetical protein AMET1_1062 [Methanonatronarchaeum thermophilum]
MKKTINQIQPNLPQKEVNKQTFKNIWKGNKKTLKQLKPNQKYKITHKNQWIILKTNQKNKIQIYAAKYKPY